VAVENAQMGLPEVSLGIIPGYGGTQRLPQLVGRGKALEMIMTGEMIDAREAQQWGLVNYTVPADELMATCERLLEKMSGRSQTAITAAIRTVNIGLMEPEKGYEEERDVFAAAFDSPDFKEGVAAFLEKRKPNSRYLCSSVIDTSNCMSNPVFSQKQINIIILLIVVVLGGILLNTTRGVFGGFLGTLVMYTLFRTLEIF